MKLIANLWVTGSSTSIIVVSSFRSASLAVSLMKPVPAEPSTERITSSGFVAMMSSSEREASSLLIFWNSLELIVTNELYSVSGMERCSMSREIRFKANSVILPVFGFSNVILRVYGSCSA